MTQARANTSSNEREELRGLHLHVAPSAGIAGDMTVAALVDAGVPEHVVAAAVGAMQVPELTVAFHGDCTPFPGLRYVVTWPGSPGRLSPHPDGRHPHHRHAKEHEHPHRQYAEIRELIRSSTMPRETKHLAETMFARLAAVEAEIHDQPIDAVAFHEVGAFDSIADIVGVAAAVTWLAPASISSSPPLLGSGTVVCAHGLVPVPAPATASLLKGRQVLTSAEGGELTTPTGALVLASLVSEFGPPPEMRIVSRGLGLGTRLLASQPNGLQVLIGQKLPDTVGSMS